MAFPSQPVPAVTGSAPAAPLPDRSPGRIDIATATAFHHPDPGKAKTYHRIRLLSGLASSVLSFAILVVLVVSDLSRELAGWAGSWSSHEYAAALLFVLAIGVLQSVLTLPLGFYSGYLVEHRFGLSNQTLGRWAWERTKGVLVALPLAAAVILVLLFCLREYGGLWWLPVSIVLTFFSVILARLAPVLILPIFYRFVPLQGGSLRERLVRLCAAHGLRIDGVFSFNMSKNTKKANAGFTGIGKSRRVILADTLLAEFTEDEIETVFAHELGHYARRHIWIGIGIGILSTFIGLYLAAELYEWSLGALGFVARTELAALPLLAIWLSLYGLVTGPLRNMLSRYHERQADSFAVTITGKKGAFVSALQKLARTNLADPEPHPLVEFLFYSHPSIRRRLALVESLDVR